MADEDDPYNWADEDESLDIGCLYIVLVWAFLVGLMLLIFWVASPP